MPNTTMHNKPYSLTEDEKDKLRAFAEQHGITWEQAAGEAPYPENGDTSMNRVPAGFNPQSGSRLEFGNLTHLPAKAFLSPQDDLYLPNVVEIPEDCSIESEGILSFDKLENVPARFRAKAQISMELIHATELGEDFAPEVNGHLLLNSITSVPSTFDPQVTLSIKTNSLPDGIYHTKKASWIAIDGNLYKAKQKDYDLWETHHGQTPEEWYYDSPETKQPASYIKRDVRGSFLLTAAK